MPLVTHYQLNGDATTVVGNKNGIASNVSWQAGKLRQCGNFNGTSSSILINSTENLIGYGDITISAWVKTAQGNNRTIVGNYQLGSSPWNGTCFTLGANGSNIGALSFWNNSNAGSWMYGTVRVDDDTWHHVVVVRRGFTIEFYVDGVLDVIRTFSGSTQVNGDDKLSIGSDTDGSSRRFLGLIDDVRIYDHAISIKEIKELTKAEVLHLKFDYENDLSDSSGQDYVASFGGTAPTWSTASKIGTGCFDWGAGDQSGKRIVVNEFQDIRDELTVSCWAYQVENGSNDNPLITFSNSTGFTTGWALWNGYGTDFRWYVNGSAIVVSLSGMYNSWNHYAGTYSAKTGNFKLYYNGDLVQTLNIGVGTQITAANRELSIGEQLRNANQSFSGKMDDIRIYASELSDADIMALAKSRASLDDKGTLFVEQSNQLLNYDPIISAPNLFLNGNGERGDATNMGGMTYLGEGVFSRTSGSSTIISTDFIPVAGNGIDRFDQYKISCEIMGRNHVSRYYFMTVCYNKYFQMINNEHMNFFSGRDTYLAQDLVAGQTVVQFENISGWVDNGTTGYINGKTFAYWLPNFDPIFVPLKYSRTFVQYGAINKTNNTVTLLSAWGGPTLPAGTLVINSQSGGTYSYIGASNPQTLLDSWRYHEGTTSTGASVGNTRFATEYIKLGWLLNRDASTGTPTTDIRNIKMWKVDGDQNPVWESHSLNENGVFDSKNTSEVSVTNNLVAWYPLKENSQDLANRQDLTPVNTQPSSQGHIFNGTSSYLQRDSVPLLATSSDTTVLCWCWPDSTGPTNQYTGLVSWGNRSVSTPSSARILSLNTNGTTMHVSSAFWGNDHTPNTLEVSANNWNFVGMISSATPWNNNVTLFSSGPGQLTFQTGSSSSFAKGLNTPGTSLGIGVTDYPGRYFKGRIQEVRIYNRALSQEEIRIIYETTDPTKDFSMKQTNYFKYLGGQLKEN